MKMKKCFITAPLGAFALGLCLLVGCGTSATTVSESTEAPAVSETETGALSEAVKTVPETETETAEPEAVTETAVTETAETETESTETAYTFTDLSQTMYAKSTVNVRDLPDSSGNKVGRLAASEEVSVTGQCNETKWYRITYKDSVAFVSNSYLVSEKPAETATDTTATTTDTSTAATDTSASATASSSSGKSGYTTVYMTNDFGTWYASDDGLTCIWYTDGTYYYSPVYTVAGLKAAYPNIGQAVQVDDNTIKILVCGCCSVVTTTEGITSYEAGHATAEALGYPNERMDMVEDTGACWVGQTPNTYTHNLCWYYYTK